MKLPRREFLHRTALGLGGLVVGTPRPAHAGAAPAYFDPFALVPLGKTSLKVTRVALGTGTQGGGRQSNHSRMGKEKFEALIRGSFDRGTRLFDLADRYGTHPYVIPALKGISRDRYEIVTKYCVVRIPGRTAGRRGRRGREVPAGAADRLHRPRAPARHDVADLAGPDAQADGPALEAQGQGHHPRPRLFVPFGRGARSCRQGAVGATRYTRGSIPYGMIMDGPPGEGCPDPAADPRRREGRGRHEDRRRGTAAERQRRSLTPR